MLLCYVILNRFVYPRNEMTTGLISRSTMCVHGNNPSHPQKESCQTEILFKAIVHCLDMSEELTFAYLTPVNAFCAGLNPLPRTIQGNNPGTTAYPLCAG